MKSDIVRLVPGDPKHIAVVKDIFKMCGEGYGFRSIVIALNDRGLSGPMNTRWNQMAVKSILQNPCYRGALAWNRRTFGKLHEVAPDGSPVSKKMPTSTRNPTDRWIVIEDVHEPIIDASLFQKAQEQMTVRRDKGVWLDRRGVTCSPAFFNARTAASTIGAASTRMPLERFAITQMRGTEPKGSRSARRHTSRLTLWTLGC